MSAKPNTNQPDNQPDKDNSNPPDGVDAKLYSEAELQARAGELSKAAQAETEELKKTLQFRDAREEMTAALTKAGARSPELLFNSAKESLQFDGEGKVANGAALVEQLKKSFPEQFGTERPSGSIDGGAGAGSETAYLTKEKLARMTAAEISKLDWTDVRKVLSEG
jgi:hypothetical protein